MDTCLEIVEVIDVWIMTNQILNVLTVENMTISPGIAGVQTIIEVETFKIIMITIEIVTAVIAGIGIIEIIIKIITTIITVIIIIITNSI